jgi:Cu2+-exporting ATPase
MDRSGKEHSTAVLDVHPIWLASEKAAVETVLGRRPGVEQVEANPVSQTATVTYDPRVTSVAELRRWVEECGCHCAGQSVPKHICDPLLEPDPPTEGHAGPAVAAMPASPPTAATEAHAAPGQMVVSPHEAMGHGDYGPMSMDAMVADMRNRFLVAAVFSVPILLWSPIGRDVFGFTVAAPFGLRDDVWSLLLSLPVIL